MTDDDAKAANAALVESMVQQLRDCVSVGDEMTLDHATLIDDAADWIAGEPARLAAAREEQREADARHLARFWYGVDANAVNIYGPVAVVRHTPLDSTPLGDEVRALRARVAELEAQAAKDDAHVVEVNDAHLKQVAALRTLRAGLERERDEAVAALRECIRLHYVAERGDGCTCRDLDAARAILAKYPEGR